MTHTYKRCIYTRDAYTTGVVPWVAALMEGVRGKLHVGEDEVERIVRQEMEKRLIAVCSAAFKEHAKNVAAATAAAASASLAVVVPEMTTSPVDDDMLVNIFLTVTKSALYKVCIYTYLYVYIYIYVYK